MTATAERLVRELRLLPRNDLVELRVQLEDLLAASNCGQISEAEFATALAEVTGATAGSHLMECLLSERRREREREAAQWEVSATLDTPTAR